MRRMSSMPPMAAAMRPASTPTPMMAFASTTSWREIHCLATAVIFHSYSISHLPVPVKSAAEQGFVTPRDL